MERHAYINIEPNNGGIVLNVSEGGLCFHSFDPVPRNGTIRFWFSDQNQRIEADAALAWTDETQKGGLRFTTLPEEARERIRSWISQPSSTLSPEASAPTSLPPRLFPIPKDRRPGDRPAFAGPTPPPGVSPQPNVAIPLSGFSRGLATGLALSVFVVVVFLFQSYRREFGESLIQLGDTIRGKAPDAAPDRFGCGTDRIAGSGSCFGCGASHSSTGAPSDVGTNPDGVRAAHDTVGIGSEARKDRPPGEGCLAAFAKPHQAYAGKARTRWAGCRCANGC